MTERRILHVTFALFVLFSLLIVQYYRIQQIEYEKWRGYAARQHEIVVPQVAKRGSFYGQHLRKKNYFQPLVYDVVKFHLFADPLSLPEEKKNEIAHYIAKQFSCPQEEIRSELARSVRSRRLLRWLPKEQKEAFHTWWSAYAKKEKIPKNALFFVQDFQRSYPFGSLSGQVLHTIRDQKDEMTKEGVPTGGLEASFHQVIRGKQGKRVLLRSPLNHMDTDRIVVEAEDGADVYLTIDPVLQTIVEQEIKKGVESAKAKGGWAVMMNASTGEVLALGQYPPFDPRHYRDYFNDPDRIEETKVKALTDCFELGSIMKPITLAVALKANEELTAQGKPPLFSPEEKIDMTRHSFPGRGGKPIKDGIVRTAMNMNMAMQKSSNIYMAQLAERIVQQMGSEWYRHTLVHSFGFGLKTGMELPAESPGMVPTPGKIHPNGRPQWSVATPYSLSFGYNILANSVQMLRAFAVLANGGELISPTLVKKVVKEGREMRKERKKIRVLPSESAQRVVKAMKFSSKPGGTGWRAEIPGFTEAGKTGTAEKVIGGHYHGKVHISSYVGFTPAEKTADTDPLVFIVSLDEPAAMLAEDGVKNYLGGRCAAPVFRSTMIRALDYLGIEPDDPFGYRSQDPRFDAQKADYLKELADLNKLYKEWNG
jgi:cell division protein FtsI (penicillin-binding protein 3)